MIHSLFALILIFSHSSVGQQADSFDIVIKCAEDDCLRVTLSFVYKSTPYVYNLIRNKDLFGSNYKKKSPINQYYIDDEGTPFAALRIGDSKEGVQGAIKVDGELKGIAFDKDTGLHFFETKSEERSDFKICLVGEEDATKQEQNVDKETSNLHWYILGDLLLLLIVIVAIAVCYKCKPKATREENEQDVEKVDSAELKTTLTRLHYKIQLMDIRQ